VPVAIAQKAQDLFNDAMAKQKAGDLKGAVEEYRQLLKLHPEATAIRSNLGAALAGLGQFAEAITEYKIALKLFPYDPYMTFNLAEQYRKFGLCGPAIPFYRWTWALDRSFPMGRTQLANCLLTVGQYDSAKVAAMGALEAGGPVRITHRIIKIADSSKAAARSAAKKNDTTSVVAMTRKSLPGGKLPETLQKAAGKADVP